MGGAVADEEPTHGELARRLDDLRADLRSMMPNLIGRAEYVADQRALDQRLVIVTSRIDDVRKQHTEDIRAVNGRITGDTDRNVTNKQAWRNALWVGFLPAMVATLIGIITIWVASRH
jgi:ABC-type thiamine transport system ATPase subunit